MKILVTGAAGQVGQEVVLAATDQQHDVLACDQQTLNITDNDVITQFFAKHTFDALVNCAAYTAVDKAEDEPLQALAVNATAVEYLAKACALKNVPMIHLSTDYVFNGEQAQPYLETDTPAPKNQYGYSKWQGELALQKQWHKHIILRVSWIFGRYGHNFVKTIVKLAQGRSQLSIVADQMGCPTGARALAQVIVQLLPHIMSDDCAFGLYHYCGEPAVSWYQFAEAIINTAQPLGLINDCKLTPIPTDAYPVKASRPQNSHLNTEKIKQIFNIAPCHWQAELHDVLSHLTR